jgi:Tfp pilus assembly protein PilO
MKSSRFTLPLLLIFIIIFVGILFYVKPAWDDVNSLTSERDQKQTEKEALTTQLKNLQDLQKSLQSSSEVSQQTSLSAIPEHFEQNSLIRDIQAIAEKSDAELNSWNFNVASGNLDKIKRATVTLNLTSSEGALLNFLNGIETNGRKLLVKSVSVQSGNSEESTPRVNFTVNMETYYQEGL